MRVLVVHNRYRSANPSGENRVVDDEIEMLRGNGIDVAAYMKDSDEIGRASLSVAIGPVYSRSGVRGFREALVRHRPDVVHLHNVYPLISPAVAREAGEAQVPVVQTVHNYRHLCAAGTFYRDGHACEDCLGKSVPWPAIAHGCYRFSHLQSVPMVAGQVVHRSTWKGLARLLPVSSFVANKLIEGGFPADRVTVRPTGIPDPGEPGPMGSGAVYVGRLDEEKGLPLLLESWEHAGLGGQTLTIVGDGPLRAVAESAAAGDERIRLTGSLPPAEVRVAMQKAALVVIPSKTYEGLPRVLIEAFAAGRAVLGCAVGALDELVDQEVGWTAAPTPVALGSAIAVALAARDLSSRGAAARERFLSTYTSEISTRRLIDIYRQVAAGA